MKQIQWCAELGCDIASDGLKTTLRGPVWKEMSAFGGGDMDPNNCRCESPFVRVKLKTFPIL